MFSKEQLEAIKEAAKKTKNQGPMAVTLYFKRGDIEDPFDNSQWNVLVYIAEECTRQRSGEMSVYWMANAWDFAQTFGNHKYFTNDGGLTLAFIEQIGSIVEPVVNRNGFRVIPIGKWQDKDHTIWLPFTPPDAIVRNLTFLLESYYDGNLTEDTSLAHRFNTPHEAFYFHFETIHPFVDGNGRTGKILYNFLNGTLDNPIMPPNFWGTEVP